MEINFKGKKVLVTGGTRGIGAAIANQYAQNGAEVFITGTSQTSFEEFKSQYPNEKAHFFAVDFSSLKEIENFQQEIRKIDFGILVNNAGINKISPAADIALGDWQQIQDINVRAPFLITQAVIKKMKENRWGRIVNMASIFGVVTKEQRLSYTTSKAALIGMTKTFALELANDQILVNAVSPGFIDTELTQKILGKTGIAEMVEKVPMKKLGTASDIANLTLFLTSDLNGFITGQNLIVDGGFTCA